MVKKQRKCSLSETYFGYVETLLDSLILFNAVINNKLPTIQKRLSRVERRSIISGSIFVFKENDAKIKRWTDGRYWSPSRILGDFLVYIELDDPRKTNKWANRKNKSKKEKKENENPILKNEELQMKKIKYKGIIPSLDLKKFNIRQNGLIKKTLSVKVDGDNYHLVSYYHEQDVSTNNIKRPSNDEELMKLYKESGNKNIEILNFRTNKKQQINMNQLTLQNPNWCIDNDIINSNSGSMNNTFMSTGNNSLSNTSIMNGNEMNSFNQYHDSNNIFKNNLNNIQSPSFIYNNPSMPPNYSSGPNPPHQAMYNSQNQHPSQNPNQPNNPSSQQPSQQNQQQQLPPPPSQQPQNPNNINSSSSTSSNTNSNSINTMYSTSMQPTNSIYNPSQQPPPHQLQHPQSQQAPQPQGSSNANSLYSQQPPQGHPQSQSQQPPAPQQAQQQPSAQPATQNNLYNLPQPSYNQQQAQPTNQNPFVLSSSGQHNNGVPLANENNNFDRSHSILFMDKNSNPSTHSSIMINDSQGQSQQSQPLPQSNFNPFLIQTPLIHSESNPAPFYHTQGGQSNDINLVNSFNNTPPLLNKPNNNSPSLSFHTLSSPTMNQQQSQPQGNIASFTSFNQNGQPMHQQSLPTPNSTPTTAPMVPIIHKSSPLINHQQALALSSFTSQSPLLNNSSLSASNVNNPSSNELNAQAATWNNSNLHSPMIQQPQPPNPVNPSAQAQHQHQQPPSNWNNNPNTSSNNIYQQNANWSQNNNNSNGDPNGNNQQQQSQQPQPQQMNDNSNGQNENTTKLNYSNPYNTNSSQQSNPSQYGNAYNSPKYTPPTNDYRLAYSNDNNQNQNNYQNGQPQPQQPQQQPPQQPQLINYSNDLTNHYNTNSVYNQIPSMIR